MSSLEHRYSETHPELDVARERVRWLEEEFRRERKTSARASSSPELESEQEALSRHEALISELEEARAEAELLRKRLLAEELSLVDQRNHVWVVEEPVEPTKSTKKPLLLVLLGAFVAGVILAVFGVAFASAFDDALRGEKEFAQALGAPSLGRMPQGGEA